MSDYAPRTRECLAAVVSSAGKNFQVDEGLKPFSNSPVEGPHDGLENDQFAVFSYLGDVLLRVVFTAPGCLQSPLRQDDMKRLDLTPERALVIATVNLKRMQGAPQVGVLIKGVYALRGSNPEESCSYLLDRVFWRSQLLKFGLGARFLGKLRLCSHTAKACRRLRGRRKCG